MDDFDDLLHGGPGGSFYSEEEDFDEYDDPDHDAGDDADDEAGDDGSVTSHLPTLILGAAAGASLVQPAPSAPAQSRWIRQYLPGMQRLEPGTGLVTHVFHLSAKPDAAMVQSFEGLRTRTTYTVAFSSNRLSITCRPEALEHAVAEVIADLEAAWEPTLDEK
jgi:hypothetical protein